MTAYDLEVPRIFEVAAMMGRRVLVVNPVPSTPIIPVKNLNVLSLEMFSHKLVYHGEFVKRYARLFPREAPAPEKCDVEDYAAIANGYLELLEKAENFDYVWIATNYPDRLLHVCPDAVERFVEGEKLFLEAIDAIVEEGLSKFDVVMVVSDHGFTLYKRVIHVNVALHKAGLARFTSDPTRAPPHTPELHKRTVLCVNPRLVYLLERLRLRGVARRAARLVSRMTRSKVVMRSMFLDWVNSEALQPCHMYGVVVRKAELIDHVIRILSEIEGVRLVEPREFYDPGPFNERYPHVIVLPDHDKGYTISHYYSSDIITERLTPDHHPDGVFSVYPMDALQDAGFNINMKLRVVNPVIIGGVQFALLGLPLQRGTPRRAIERILGVKLSEADYTVKWRIAKRFASRTIH